MQLEASTQKRLGIALLTLMLSATLFSSTSVYASSLDGIGTETKQTEQGSNATQQSSSSTKEVSYSSEGAEAVAGIVDGIGIDSEASAKANQFLAPAAKVVNIVSAVILGAASLIMFGLTSVDLLFIVAPPFRKILNPEGAGSAPSGGFGGGGFGGGGFGGGGFGGGFGGASSQTSSGGMRWVSDEAVAAVGSMQAPASGGGFGGGGFGGGGFGTPQAPPKMKNVLVSYMKKRIVFMFSFGVCIVLFSTMIFTDLGVQLGSFLLDKLLGI